MGAKFNDYLVFVHLALGIVIERKLTANCYLPLISPLCASACFSPRCWPERWCCHTPRLSDSPPHTGSRISLLGFSSWSSRIRIATCWKSEFFMMNIMCKDNLLKSRSRHLVCKVAGFILLTFLMVQDMQAMYVASHVSSNVFFCSSSIGFSNAGKLNWLISITVGYIRRACFRPSAFF